MAGLLGRFRAPEITQAVDADHRYSILLQRLRDGFVEIAPAAVAGNDDGKQVSRARGGQFYEIQCKARRQLNYSFIEKTKFPLSDARYLCLLLFLEAEKEEPKIFQTIENVAHTYHLADTVEKRAELLGALNQVDG